MKTNLFSNITLPWVLDELTILAIEGVLKNKSDNTEKVTKIDSILLKSALLKQKITGVKLSNWRQK